MFVRNTWNNTTVQIIYINIYNWFGLVSLFNSISNANTILVEEQFRYCLTHTWGGDKRVHAFPEGISPKANTIEKLKLKLAYFEVPVEQLSHYVT